MSQTTIVVARQKQQLDLGRTVATPGALAALEPFPGRVNDLLARHASGNWGCVCAEDAKANARALKHGNRILSAYPVDAALPSKGWGDNTVWIITEWDRSVTTVLLPEEY